jgi:hypothetical protein
MKFGLFTMPKSLLVSEPEIITKGVIAYQRALPPQSNSLPRSAEVPVLDSLRKNPSASQLRCWRQECNRGV